MNINAKLLRKILDCTQLIKIIIHRDLVRVTLDMQGFSNTQNKLAQSIASHPQEEKSHDYIVRHRKYLTKI